MFIIIGILVLIIFTFIGFFIWATSDLPLAIKELAINSRQGKIRGSMYALLNILGLLIKILAIATWVIGMVLSFAVAYLLIPGNIMSFLNTLEAVFSQAAR